LAHPIVRGRALQKPISLWKQLLVITIRASMAGGVWHYREQVSQRLGLSVSESSSNPGERRRRGRGSADAAVSIIAAPVTLARHNIEVVAIGTGRAEKSVSLFPKAAGEVVSVNFKAGDRVNAGAALVELDSRQQELAVRLTLARLEEANRAMERTERLLGRGVTAEASADTTRTAAQTAAIEHDQALENLAERTVRAPFDGVIGIPQVEVGDRISESSVISTLDARTEILVEFEVPEAYIARLYADQPLTATNPGFQDREFQGRISAIDSRVDAVARTIRVRAAIDNTEDLLRAGMSFAVKLVLEGSSYPSVPELAMQWSREGRFVWRVDGTTVERVMVQSVARIQSRLLVDGALREGDLVVVEGVQRLTPGQAVRLSDPEPDIARGPAT
jgi:RND family efflux transporter MFP subunit